MSAIIKGMSPFRFVLGLIVASQLVGVLYFFGNSNGTIGLYNRDVFSYTIQVSKTASDLNPLNEPILADPGHDLIRLPFSFPHFFSGVLTKVTSPVVAYLILCCLGSALYFYSLWLLAKALGFNEKQAAFAAFIHYAFFQFLSQLPPLSINQLQFLGKYLTFDAITLLHTGPRQYPHDIFFYPIFYTLLAMTLQGVKMIRERMQANRWHLAVWLGLGLILPLNYFYHWLEFGAILAGLFIIGFFLKWWTVKDWTGQYKSILYVLIILFSWWGSVLIFQSYQLKDEVGNLFSLASGLTEARYLHLPFGQLLRIVLWSGVALFIFRTQPRAIVLVLYLFVCVGFMNMQLVVGKNIQPGHWSFGIDRVFAWILLLAVLWLIEREYYPAIVKKVKGIVLVLAFMFFFVQNYVSWKQFHEMSKWDNERNELISYLNTLEPSVALVPEVWLETDVLIFTDHYSFLPRGAQSAVSRNELMGRLTHAGMVLGYSEVGFKKWIHTRAVRFFGFLYGTDPEFTSTLYFKSHEEVMKFSRGDMTSMDSTVVSQYINNTKAMTNQLDFVVQYKDESLSPFLGKVIFENDKYRVSRIEPMANKKWGENMPISDRPYPL